MSRELLVRTASGVTLGLVVLALTWIGGLAFKLLSVVGMGLVFYEWFRIVQTRQLSKTVWAIGAVSLLLVAICIFARWGGLAMAVSAAGAGLCMLVRALEGRDAWPAIGVVYAGFAGVAFAELRDSGQYGFAILIFLFAVVWATDICAYFGGRHFGGPKLAPVISPGKTWSGFAIGLFGGVVAGTIAAVVLVGSSVGWIIVLATLISVSGQVGDLFESGFKRQFGVKDSGTIIPGHGGVMDRVDSIIFAAFSAYLVGVALPGHRMSADGGNGIALQLLGP
ncbi:phosphatidate cytidylyltransferase [Hoeflea prorocentri]|uniref:Phosphatidate cytidylyltransferase n=1 Tax=Hoeflea prorocentri TaxID=1922333 RepID=A0A9X3ZHJ7_9HYPH|nr:phosphatidate cytidylyltransferase [Hoeflea prorocentri]MCY6380941.1 phosphatidate cytidylyltransferase [Hoeflea prorocentri]MDA5398741.1 phosphatidate cytidylyltransferase [Hoeflea prorocentri]